MSSRSLLSMLDHSIAASRKRRARPARWGKAVASRHRRLAVEPLEERCLLTLIPTTTLLSVPEDLIFGQPATFAATVAPVSPGSGVPTGSVVFSDISTGAGLGTATLTDGTASLAVSAFTAGNHAIRADYQGDATFAASTQPIGPGSLIQTYAGNGTRGFGGDWGPATNASFNGPSGIAFDGQGNLYIADIANHRVRMVHTSGNIYTVVGNGSTTSSGDGGRAYDAGLPYPSTVAVQGTSLYVAEAARVRQVDIPNPLNIGNIITVAGTGTLGYSEGDDFYHHATTAMLNRPRDLAFLTPSQFLIADMDNHRIRQVDFAIWGGQISTIAGNGTYGFSGDGGPATAAQLANPYGLAVDSAGHVFIADDLNYRVRQLDLATGVITTIAGDGQGAYSGDGGPATAAGMSPQSVVVDGAGHLYIADTGSDRVRMVDLATGIITTVVGSGLEGDSGDGGPAGAARIRPFDMAIGPGGHLYICDSNADRIRRVIASEVTTVDPVNTTITLTASPAKGEFGQTMTFTADIRPVTPVTPPPNAYWNFWGTVEFIDTTTGTSLGTVDAVSNMDGNSGSASISTSNLAVGNHTIVARYSGNSNFRATDATPESTCTPLTVAVTYTTSTTLAASAASVTAGQAVTFTATVTSDASVAPTPTGGTVTFYDKGTVLGTASLSAGTAALTVTLAGDGPHAVTAVYSGDGAVFDGSASVAGPFSLTSISASVMSRGLAVDAVGNRLFYTTSYSSMVYEIDLSTGVNTWLAGGGNGFGGDNGPATAAQLSYPEGLALDGNQYLFIADSGNHRIRQINLTTGIITTVAGNGTQGYSGDGGPATAAAPEDPYGVAVDATGNVYFTEPWNSRIRRIDRATGIITTIAGNGQSGYGGDGGPATDAVLGSPWDIEINSARNIYFVDGSSRIRKINHATCFITTVAGNGSQGYAGDGGPATEAQIRGYGLAVDGGYLFLGDFGGARAVNLFTGIIYGMAGTHANDNVEVDDAGRLFGSEDSTYHIDQTNYATLVTVNDPAPLQVTIDQAEGQLDPGSGAVRFAVQFSKLAQGFTVDDVMLEGTAPGKQVTSVRGSGKTYEVTVTATGNGTLIARIPAGVVLDSGGNPNLASTSTDNTVVYDITAPTVTINQAAGQTDPTSHLPIGFAVVFTEPVNDFTAGDVTIGGTAPGTRAVEVTGGPTTYNVAVSGMTGSGTVIASLAAGVAHDSAGNPNLASTSADNLVTYNVTPPTVTINQAAGQTDPAGPAPLVFTATFSEPVTALTAAGVDLSLSTRPGSLVATVTPVAGTGGTTYNVAVSGMTGKGTVIAAIKPDAVQDGVGNFNVASTSTDNAVAYDATDYSAQYGFAFRLGSSSGDSGAAIATDTDGNVYVAGLLGGTIDFDPGAGGASRSGDAFVAKYTATGAYVWARSITGDIGYEGVDMAVADGYVYLTGGFQGTVDFNPDPTGTSYLNSGANPAAFVLKLDTGGNFVWAKSFFGGETGGLGIGVDGSGNVYTTGFFSGTVDFDPSTTGEAPLTSAGSYDAYVSKLDSFGTYLWAKRMGGAYPTGDWYNVGDRGNDLAVDPDGNVYTTGTFRGIIDFDPGPLQTLLTSSGNFEGDYYNDAFVWKLNTGGAFVWAKQPGWSGRGTQHRRRRSKERLLRRRLLWDGRGLRSGPRRLQRPVVR